MDDWNKKRQMLSALGVEDIDMLDDVVSGRRDDEPEPAATDPATRRRQIEAFVAGSGGM